MPAFTGIKEVRNKNGQQFIDDFKKYKTVVVMPQYTKGFYIALRSDVWEYAKDRKLLYLIRNDVFKNQREVMVIV